MTANDHRLDSRQSSAGQIEAIPENLLRAPIDYLCSDHFRQRIICKFIDEIAFDRRGDNAIRLAAIALEYLEGDLRQHVMDEERDLFPLLRSRCEPEDDIERIMTVLSAEHAIDEGLMATLMPGLRKLARNRQPSDEAAFLRSASVFAESQRRHLAWEESLILPLARKRLSTADLETMGRNMAERRGLSYPASDD